MNQGVSFLYGPTASGKTQWALDWAARTGGNLVSADARQVYQEMHVVVGQDLPPQATWVDKPSDWLPPCWQVFNGPKIWGLDVVAPDQVFSLSQWYKWVQPIAAWHLANKVPLLVVGGTWQWHQVFFNPPASLFLPPDPDWRQTAASLELSDLQKNLADLDPDGWRKLTSSDQANRQRLIRKIEIAQAEEKGLSPSPPQPLIPKTSPSIWIRDREIDDLTAAIQARVLYRWKNGAKEETQQLKHKYPDWSAPAFTASGYPIIRQHLEGKLSEESAIRTWGVSERNYAKRQRTWIRKIKQTYAYELV